MRRQSRAAEYQGFRAVFLDKLPPRVDDFLQNLGVIGRLVDIDIEWSFASMKLLATQVSDISNVALYRLAPQRQHPETPSICCRQ